MRAVSEPARGAGGAQSRVCWALLGFANSGLIMPLATHFSLIFRLRHLRVGDEEESLKLRLTINGKIL